MMTEIYISMKPLWKIENIFHVRVHLHLHLHLHLHVHTHIHTYTYAYTHIHKYTCMYMCVCVYVCEGKGEEREGRGVVLGGSVGGWVGEYVLVRVCVCCVVLCCVSCVSCVSCVCVVVSLKIKWSSTASSGKANDWRTRERVVLDLFSNLE